MIYDISFVLLISFFFFLALHQNLVEVNDVASITLALKTLGSFDFQGAGLSFHIFSSFVVEKNYIYI